MGSDVVESEDMVVIPLKFYGADYLIGFGRRADHAVGFGDGTGVYCWTKSQPVWGKVTPCPRNCQQFSVGWAGA